MESEIEEAHAHIARSLLAGLLFWSASALAVAIALAFFGAQVIWYGGMLVAPFHWYRAARVAFVLRRMQIMPITRLSMALVAATVGVCVTTLRVLLPAYDSVNSPDIGTCWSDKNGQSAPVPCWSPSAALVTVAYATSEEGCPTEWVFPPTVDERRFICIREK